MVNILLELDSGSSSYLRLEPRRVGRQLVHALGDFVALLLLALAVGAGHLGDDGRHGGGDVASGAVLGRGLGRRRTRTSRSRAGNSQTETRTDGRTDGERLCYLSPLSSYLFFLISLLLPFFLLQFLLPFCLLVSPALSISSAKKNQCEESSLKKNFPSFLFDIQR